MKLRRSPARLLGRLVAAGALFASAPADAGDKTPLSALPTLPASRDRTEPPKEYGVAGLSVNEHDSAARAYHQLVAAAARGYCLADTTVGLHLTTSTTTFGEQQELWRLVEADGKATFERTRFELAAYLGKVWMKSKTTIELREVARSNGVTVWGFRSGGAVVLLAKRARSGREIHPNPEAGSFDFVSSDCSFGAVRLEASTAKSGTLAQLHGELPPVGDGKARIVPRFVVDGSLAKLSRDPEPVLAVRVRTID